MVPAKTKQSQSRLATQEILNIVWYPNQNGDHMIIDIFKGSRILDFWDFITSYPLDKIEVPKQMMSKTEVLLSNVYELEYILNEAVANDYFLMRRDTFGGLRVGFIVYKSEPVQYSIRVDVLRRHFGAIFDKRFF